MADRDEQDRCLGPTGHSWAPHRKTARYEARLNCRNCNAGLCSSVGISRSPKGRMALCSGNLRTYEPAHPQTYLSYFQFLFLPSPTQVTVCATRLARVSAALAPVIHSTYSRLWLGLMDAKVFAAARRFASAAFRSAGT